MRKFISYGMFVAGVALCLYSPVARRSFQHNQQSNLFAEEDSIGQIKIPKIGVNLPIYKSTEEDVLQKGIGCMAEGSPLGTGQSAHSILVGHRGLPHADLFLRLDKLEMGDDFTIYVSEKELSYKVCNIQVIRPEETKALQIQTGKDMVSLVTCTPYGINTHRLVITGERKSNDE